MQPCAQVIMAVLLASIGRGTSKTVQTPTPNGPGPTFLECKGYLPSSVIAITTGAVLLGPFTSSICFNGASRLGKTAK